MRKERMGVGMGLNLLLLLAMLYTIRATITHLRSLSLASTTTSAASATSAPPELLLYSRVGGPIGSACSDQPDLLRRYMNYTPFSACPDDLLSVAEPLLLRGCQPLPRRRCFSPTVPRALPASLLPPPFPAAPLPDSAVLWPRASPCRSFSCLPGAAALGFDLARTEAARFMSTRSALDLTLPQLLRLARSHGAAPIRLALDVGGGTGTLAARLRLLANATVLTTTMNLGAPYSQAAALRGLVPLHAPLQQRFPVADAVLDLVRTGHAVNRWIPAPVLEFLLYDADRVLRPGAFLWIDHFSCRRIDLHPSTPPSSPASATAPSSGPSPTRPTPPASRTPTSTSPPCSRSPSAPPRPPPPD
uniref:Methyltransferase type 11 domain-containing protein n=1 Tax=Ananas comosus var. bracteatus TaxID=296719 RepID=A0A6V7QZ28_ANACO